MPPSLTLRVDEVFWGTGSVVGGSLLNGCLPLQAEVRGELISEPLNYSGSDTISDQA